MFYGDGPIAIGDNVSIGNGTVIYASKNGGITIGKGTMIKANCNIGHDVITGELCHFAMGATICSCLTIGDCVDVALNATLLANVNMGNFSMLGAASLATHDVPDYEIHVGIPAKFLKRMKED